MVCKKCGEEIERNSNFCANCGASKDYPSLVQCKSCGGNILENAKFCNICGSSEPYQTNKTLVQQQKKNTAPIVVFVFSILISLGLILGAVDYFMTRRYFDYTKSEFTEMAHEYTYSGLLDYSFFIRYEPIKLTGLVMQVTLGGDEFKCLVIPTDNEDKVVMCRFENADTTPREGDFVSILGVSKGTDTYELIAGGKNTVPFIEARYIEICGNYYD